MMNRTNVARRGLAIVVAAMAAALVSLVNVQPAHAEAHGFGENSMTSTTSTFEPGHI